jgi:hypothetical protein
MVPGMEAGVKEKKKQVKLKENGDQEGLEDSQERPRRAKDIQKTVSETLREL